MLKNVSSRGAGGDAKYATEKQSRGGEEEGDRPAASQLSKFHAPQAGHDDRALKYRVHRAKRDSVADRHVGDDLRGGLIKSEFLKTLL